MPPEESPEQKYERLKRQLQDTVLREYPNPERRGCPGDVVVRALAAIPLDQNLEGDPNWHHVTHCSECYGEFLAFQAAMKQRAGTRRHAIGWTVAAGLVVLVAAAIFVFWRGGSTLKHPEAAELSSLIRDIDLNKYSETRSENASGEKGPIVLGRGREHWRIKLPFGSRAGQYDVSVNRAAGQPPLVAATGTAAIHDGTTELSVDLDLSSLAPGGYVMGVHPVRLDWAFYPAFVR